MKTTFIILLLTVFVQINAQKSYDLEDKIWDCISTQFANEGIEISEELKLYNEFLVDKQYLSDGSAKSYLDLCRRFIELNDIVPPPANERYSEILKTMNSPETKVKCIQEDELMQTRVYEVYAKGMAALETGKDMNPTLLAEVMFSVYTEEDLKHPFYRFTFLAGFNSFASRGKGISQKIPPPPPPPKNRDAPTVSPRNMVEIQLTTKDSILLEGEPVSLVELRPRLMKYLAGSVTDESLPEIYQKEIPAIGIVDISRATISLNVRRETAYATYIAVQNEITTAVNFRRDKMAQKYFDKDFESLSKEQKKIIKKIVPYRLSQAKARD